MRGWSLRVLAPVAAVGLVAAVTAGVLAVAWTHTARLTREEAIARAERAAAVEGESLSARAAELERAARLLAERPTLARLAAAGQTVELQAFLESFRATGGFDGLVASMPSGRLVAGTEPAPTALEGVRLEGSGEHWRMVAGARSPLDATLTVAVARRLPPPASAGASLQLLDAVAASGSVGGTQAAARHAALEGIAGAGWDPMAGAFAARPLTLAGGGTVGVLEAVVPRREVEAPLLRLFRRALAASLAVALAAALVAAALAGRWARSLDELSRAALAIGAGDLEHPVQALPGRELGGLAARLDEMRSRLRRAGAELGRRQAEMEAVVSGIAEGVVAVDRDRRVRFLSAPAAQLLGVDAAAAMGAFCGDVLRPAPVDGVAPCDTACPILHARFRGAARALEALAVAGGERQPFVVASAAPAGDMQVVILRQESALEAARRARDAAVADLAHELQTPLAAQGASLELLRERLAESDERALDLVVALEAGTFRLRRLIDNLLESVRIESGQLAIRRVEVDLDEVIEEALAMTRPLLARRGQALELELPRVLPRLTGDPQRLGQVIVNLLSNASKYGPEASTVRLGVRVAPAELELWVSDRGAGFATVPAAGARFRRGAAEPPQAGSGLGLWLCRSILERHGGELRVERAGEETRVSAFLPLGDVA